VELLLLLAELQKEFHMGLILITHDLGVVARVADRVVVMYAGQIVESGTAEQIYRAPTHPYTQGLLDCIPIPGKTARGQPLGSIPGIVPSLVGAMAGCHFHERCPYAMADCAAGAVPLRQMDAPGHAYRCLLSAERCAENAKRQVPA
jgi:peptide/nickel transport system ATP-binding protein